MNAELSTVEMSRDEARSLTDEVKNDAERLWRKLVELYEGGAHRTLGYTSWSSYFKTEFGGSKAVAYRMLDAGRVARELESPMGDSPVPTERQARELAPLKNDPEKLREAWDEANEISSPPTAATVREIVGGKVGQMSNRATMNANAEVRRVHKALASVSGFCSSFDGLRTDRVLSVATEADIAAWESLALESISALNRLRRSLKERT